MQHVCGPISIFKNNHEFTHYCKIDFIRQFYYSKAHNDDFQNDRSFIIMHGDNQKLLVLKKIDYIDTLKYVEFCHYVSTVKPTVCILNSISHPPNPNGVLNGIAPS